jgi:hypothetical protein
VTVHFVHIGKTGGTSIKGALRAAKRAGACPDVQLNKHTFTMKDLADGDTCFFAVRDPVARYVSGFYSRLRQGQPRYDRPWSADEAVAFGHYSTPRELANALAARTPESRHAMESITHLRRPLRYWLGKPGQLRERSGSIVYIARQETLSDDWARLRTLLAVPDGIGLPDDSRKAHRRPSTDDNGLDDVGRAAVEAWYAEDYELLAICDELRRTRFGVPG